jgi:hypothetical protein
MRTNLTAQAIDDVLAGTFPASDPPAWTPGMARPAPQIAKQPADTTTGDDRRNAGRPSGVIDVSRPPDANRTLAQALVSLIGGAGLALLVPVAVLAIGTPLVLGVRSLVDLAAWLLALVG